jgi:hypothetical protein
MEGAMKTTLPCRTPARYVSALLWMALIEVPLPGAAQTVTGLLLDASSGAPVPAGTVSLMDDGAQLVSVVSDADGNFVLQAPQPGSFRLRAERIGYQTAETPPLELGAGDTLRVEFSVSVDAVLLNPIRVIGYSRRPAGLLGGFYDRLHAGLGGSFITRAQIDERMPNNTTDLLRTLPGVHVSPARWGTGHYVRLRGGCSPEVYLDGVPIRLLGMSIDALVQPMNLEGLEVYRGPSEMPAEFARGTCGAIVLWTRRDS